MKNPLNVTSHVPNHPSALQSLSARALFGAALALSLVAGCDPSPADPIVEDRDRTPDDNDGETDPYSPALLEEYKRALPSGQVLKAPAPSSDLNAQIGDAAAYPALAAPQVMAVNALVTGLVSTMEAITALPPTVYNSDTKEFVWGPFDDDQSALSGDKVLVYIKDNGEGTSDFRYSYAFLRGLGNDTSTYAPVIWGAAQPGELEDHGVGLVLYDLEANRAWEDENNPGHGALAAGRFAIAFARGPAENDDNAIVSLVLSTFRGFKEAGAPEGPGHDMDQLYGHVTNVGDSTATVDFVSILAEGNVHPDDQPDSLKETIDLRLAFVNGGFGRAEAVVSGGDLDTDTGSSTVSGVECWDNVLARTHLELSAEGELAANEDDGVLTIHQEGDVSMCGELFANTLAELNVPSLDDVDPAHLASLDEIATNGL